MEKLYEINRRMRTCIRCPLCEDRLNVVPGRGSFKASLLVLEQCPGKNEDEKAKSVTGRSGNKLAKMMRLADIPTSQYYITNLVKCRPLNDRKPVTAEIRTCVPTFLVPELLALKPKAIIPIGTFAAQTILGRKEKIGELAGKHYVSEIYGLKFDIFPTYHPAYVLRNAKEESVVVDHLKAVMKFVEEIEKGE